MHCDVSDKKMINVEKIGDKIVVKFTYKIDICNWSLEKRRKV